MKLRIDLETYSDVDLKRCGVHRYVDSEHFEILLFGFKFGSGPAHVIDLASGEKIPDHICSALFDPSITKTAWNAAFEMACLSKHFSTDIDPRQWRCSAVHALYLGLPNSLGEAGKVLGLSEDKRKMGIGRGLINYFCKPCRPTKTNGGRTRNLPRHDPGKWSLFKEYCATDITAEESISEKLIKFPVPEKEQKLWELDQRMIAHGVLLDMGLVNNAIEMDSVVKEKLYNEAVQLTGLANPNSRNQLLTWLREAEDDDRIEDLTKKNIPKILDNTESDTTRRVLEIRQELAKTSVSKYHAMARAVCSDSCVRGLTQFYGANRTGRMAGRIVQVQNLPQNHLKDLDLARQLVKEGDLDTLEMMFGNVPDTLSQLIRTAFISRPNSFLMPVDYSAIEARMVAWVAWCEWRMEVFKTHGKIYEASAEKMFNLQAGSVTKKSPYRAKGKVGELACGYGGGKGALINMGALDMGLPEEDLQGIIDAWRKANQEIVSLWYALERAAKTAVVNKSAEILPIAGGRSRLVFEYLSGILFIELPNGRRLSYVKPRIEPEDLYVEKADGARFRIAAEGSLTYEGVDQKTKRWGRVATYGGKLLENISQAISRDVLTHAMLALDDAGFQQLFTVHDEIIIEGGAISLPDIERIMGEDIPWAPGLPLKAEGFVTPYYMKEID
jgi:DNA polymerase